MLGKKSPNWVIVPIVLLTLMSFALSEVDRPGRYVFSQKISLIESEFPDDLKETVMEITSYKCSTSCKDPSWEGMLKPPKGVYFHEFKT